MEELVNEIILGLRPYVPGKPVEEVIREYHPEKVVKLASNENPFSLPANVADAIRSGIRFFNRYPDTDCYRLRKKIAQHNGIDLQNIIIGSGSVELIRMLAKLFLKQGQKVLTAEATFPSYRAAAKECLGEGSVIEIPNDEGGGFDLERMSALMDDSVKLIFIANPNNPTGTLLAREKLLSFIDRVPQDKMIVLDNAYQEYVENPAAYLDGIDLALKRRNIIVLRTFSKIYALAGLRIGYAIANQELIGFLNRLKSPFNVTSVAQEAALASLDNEDFKKRTVEMNIKNKARLTGQITALGLKLIPSAANFVLFYPRMDISVVNEELLKEGVIIRPLKAFGVSDGMRVTVGLEKENDYFIEKLKKVMDRLNTRA